MVSERKERSVSPRAHTILPPLYSEPKGANHLLVHLFTHPFILMERHTHICNMAEAPGEKSLKLSETRPVCRDQFNVPPTTLQLVFLGCLALGESRLIQIKCYHITVQQQAFIRTLCEESVHYCCF